MLNRIVFIGNSLIALQANILNYLGQGAECFQEYSDVLSWPRVLWKSIESSLCFENEMKTYKKERLGGYRMNGMILPNLQVKDEEDSSVERS